MKQTILVTGASSGFGLLIAQKLHEEGHQVIGTSRQPEQYQSKVPFKLLALDIANHDSIQVFTSELFKEIKQLDVLINNAGYMLMGLAEETPVESGREQFETNFWGTINVTNALLPYFRKQKHGKIITTSSIVGLIGMPNLSYYTASKHALEGYFKSLRFELNAFNIKVSLVEPMYFKTKIGENSVAAKGSIKDYDSFRNKVTAYGNAEFNKAPGPEAVMKTVIKIVNAKNPKVSYPVGAGANVILSLQLHAYCMFESAILKAINKFQ